MYILVGGLLYQKYESQLCDNHPTVLENSENRSWQNHESDIIYDINISVEYLLQFQKRPNNHPKKPILVHSSAWSMSGRMVEIMVARPSQILKS